MSLTIGRSKFPSACSIVKAMAPLNAPGGAVEWPEQSHCRNRVAIESFHIDFMISSVAKRVVRPRFGSCAEFLAICGLQSRVTSTRRINTDMTSDKETCEAREINLKSPVLNSCSMFRCDIRQDLQCSACFEAE